MLQLVHVTSAPSSRRVSMSTAVWMVMCRQPAAPAPLSGFCVPNSLRRAMSPGISLSAIAISLRPQSARPMSLTLKFSAMTLSFPFVLSRHHHLPRQVFVWPVPVERGRDLVHVHVFQARRAGEPAQRRGLEPEPGVGLVAHRLVVV